jgi:hypothetical protein
MATPTMLKPSEVRERLTIGRTKMAGLLADGTLEHIKLGPRTIRIYERSVAKILGVPSEDERQGDAACE